MFYEVKVRAKDGLLSTKSSNVMITGSKAVNSLVRPLADDIWLVTVYISFPAIVTFNRSQIGKYGKVRTREIEKMIEYMRTQMPETYRYRDSLFPAFTFGRNNYWFVLTTNSAKPILLKVKSPTGNVSVDPDIEVIDDAVIYTTYRSHGGRTAPKFKTV